MTEYPHKDIYNKLYTICDINMSYFQVEQLFDFAFNAGNIAYNLPETVKKLLVDLESCLEITDTAIERKDNNFHNHARDRDNREKVDNVDRVKYRNRYDFDMAPTKDTKKKRDFKRTPGHSLEKAEQLRNDEEWELMRAFKPTKIETKTGIDKCINDIRIALNKISASNYDKQRDAIFELVNGYFSSEEETTNANTMRISKTVFDIASTNKFYSEIYAKLYKELVDTHAIFRELLEQLITGFIAMDTIPTYIDSDVDYDGFCAYLKACEIRKSISTFIVNCFKLGIIPVDKLTDILSEFVKYVNGARVDPSLTKSVEEVVDNIYIIATLADGDLLKNATWQDHILPTIRRFVSEKDGAYPGMSNRTIFKLMDVLDKLLK
jgi:hypothetical protein